MATKTRPAMPLPGRHGDPLPKSDGDVPPPLPPSRRPAPTPPSQEEPPLPSRLPPRGGLPVPKGRNIPEPEPEYDDSADNVDQTYDEFDIDPDPDQPNGSESPPPPSPPPQTQEPDQEYDEWQQVPDDNQPELYEIPDEISNQKPAARPALPARNAPPPSVPQQEDVYEEPGDSCPPPDANNEVYEDPDMQDEYEVPDEKGSVAPPSLPSRPVNRAPVPAPPKSSKATTKSASAAGINIDSGALGSALKGLKRVINNTPKDEEKSTGGSEILTQKLNIKEAINKFETGDKPAMLPKPKVISSTSSARSVSSVSSTENKPTTPTPRKESVASAKDMPLPSIPSEEVFDEIYDECASNLLASYPWYHGTLSREESERKLRHLDEDGAFLVRDSTKSPDQPYTLVLLYNRVVKNLKVRLRRDQRIALGEEKKDEITFKDVIDMVEHHKRNEVILIKENAKVKLLKTPPKS